MDFQNHAVFRNYNCALPLSAMESNNLYSGNHSISWPLHRYNDVTKVIEALAKYNVTANQTTAVVHDKATKACLDGKLS